ISFKQVDLTIKGHSIELRVYAEDPENNFLPDTGRLDRYVRPQGPGVRVDDGYEEGMDIPIHYDPMLAKLVTYGKDRKEAIDRMLRAIDEYKITGIKTTLPFGTFALKHPDFIDGSFTTKFVEKHFTPEALKAEITDELAEVAALFAYDYDKNKQKISFGGASPQQKTSNWRNRIEH
ncbi:MAG: biotin carboxylase, partial [Cyclobacteriaceae bacterium]